MLQIRDIIHNGVIVGVEIQDEKQVVFIDRDPDTSDSEVLEEIEKMRADMSLCLENGYATTDAGSILGIGKTIEPVLFPTQARTTLSGVVEPNRKLQILRDEGTLGKNNWRFQMSQYVEQIFGRNVPENSGVVFMPGMGREEFGLWSSFQVSTRQMHLIEGDNKKVSQIKQNYPLASHVNSFLGKGDESFSKELIESLDNTPVSVLSFDTEISLTQGLIQDLAGIIANIYIQDDVFFMVNIVQRGSYETAKKMMRTTEDNSVVVNAAMEKLPERLIEMSGRDDLCIMNILSGSYLGGSSSSMNYVFCHIRRK